MSSKTRCRNRGSASDIDVVISCARKDMNDGYCWETRKLSKCENLVPARIASFRQVFVTASHLGESQAANSVSPPNP